ncbi:MAG: DUF4340 domain-containing protein [bacterium]|nr:DUF4340 domain-containing protein [bacterium]
MKSKTLTLLAVVLVGLIAVSFLTEPGQGGRGNEKAVELLSSVAPSSVKKIVIESGDQIVSLSQVEGNWTVKEKNGYAADVSRVSSLLLKMFSLKTADRLATNEDLLKELGIADKNSGTRLGLWSDDVTELKALIVSPVTEARKVGTTLTLGARYVRVDGSLDVYLVKDALDLPASPAYWIRSNLLDVSPDKIVSVSRTDGKGNFDVTFTEGNEASLEDLKADEQLSDLTVSQLQSALENLKVSDVEKRDGQSDVSDTLVFKTKDGVSYTTMVVSNEGKDETPERWISVSAAVVEPEVDPAQDDANKENKSAAEEVRRFNEMTAGWYFRIPDYVATRLIVQRDGLLNAGETGPIPVTPPMIPMPGK